MTNESITRISPEGLRLCGAKAAAAASGKGASGFYNSIRNGTWTKGIALGAKTVRWPQYEIDAQVAARIAGHSDDELRELVKTLHSIRPQVFERIMQDMKP